MRTQLRRLLVLGILTLMYVAVAGELRAQFTYQKIAYPGATSTVATGISGTTVVGYVNAADGGQFAFQFSGGTLKKLMPSNGLLSAATGISGKTIVGTYLLTSDPNNFYPFVFNGVTYTTLHPTANATGYASAVDGKNVVGNYQFFSSGPYHAFLYDGKNYTLIDYPGASNTAVSSISGTTVVGSFQDNLQNDHAFSYKNGVYTEIIPPGSIFAEGLGVSGNNIIGRFSNGVVNRDYYYDGTTFFTGVHPYANSYLTGVSGTSVVGASGDTNPGFLYNFLYMFNDLYATVKPELAASTVVPVAISGSNVTGTYIDPASENVSFLATAIIPTAMTRPATGLTPTSATINGTVTVKSTPVYYYFEYGATAAYGHKTGLVFMGANGGTAQAVNIPLAGLSPKTTYHYRVAATTTGVATGTGADSTFTTLAVPTFVGFSTQSVGAAGTIVSQQFDPNGLATTVYFVYGTTTAYGNQTAPQVLRAGSAPVTISAVIPNTSANTPIHYQMVIVTAGGTFKSQDYVFTTLPEAPALVTSSGGTVVTFGPPSINAFDHIAYTKTSSATKITSIVADDGNGSGSLVATTGQAPIGDASGIIFATLGNPVYNNNDRVAFVGGVKTGTGGATAANSSGVWMGNSSGLTLVARSGSQAPGEAAGVTFKSFTSIALNDQNDVIVLATLNSNTAAKITTTNNTGIWEVHSGTLQLVAQTGSGTPKVTGLSIFPVVPIVGNENRSFDSQTDAVTYTTTASDKSQVANVTNLGTTQQPVQTGSAATGVAGAKYSSIGPVAINTSVNLDGTHRVAYKATMTNQAGSPAISATSNTGIWADDSNGTRTLVARTGAAPAGFADGRLFATLGDPVYNGNNKLAFIGTLKTGLASITTTNATAVWFGDSNGLTIIAQQGAQAAGCPAGATFKSFDALDLADQGGPGNKGSTIIRATLNSSTSAGVTTANNVGIWAVDDSNAGVLQLIARTGDSLNGKTISTISFLPTLTTVGGQSRSVSQETGDLTFLVTFVDKRQAIYKVVFP